MENRRRRAAGGGEKEDRVDGSDIDAYRLMWGHTEANKHTYPRRDRPATLGPLWLA